MINKTIGLHYLKLIARTLLFICAVTEYIRGKTFFVSFFSASPLAVLVSLLFGVEMLRKFFPSGLDAMGCQKQFKRNFKETTDPCIAEKPDGCAIRVALAWLLLNGAVAALYYIGIIDSGILFLISLFYAVSDIICILFFCPFQALLMKNKCCVSCRIYNWDYIMMFSPLFLIKNIYTLSLAFTALILFVRWEYFYHRYPERFSEKTNENLLCKNCTEKLCRYKRQLRKHCAFFK